jgi:hypothetical protein
MAQLEVVEMDSSYWMMMRVWILHSRLKQEGSVEMH